MLPLTSGAQPRLRVVFFGTAELACPSLAALAADSRFELAAVVTQPDRPKGRELKLQPPPAKAEALRWSVSALQPERARKPEFVEALAGLRPALIVVAAYGQILPPAILDLPAHGCLNVHASLLPKYRGAAPIQWAILNGEVETGVTIMKMDPGLDTGDILSQKATAIGSADNAQTLHDRLARLGAELLLQTIPGFIEGRIKPRKQPDEGSSYARKISKEDGRVNWDEPARMVWNRVRAFTPWPGAFTVWRHEARERLLKIAEAEVAEQFTGSPGEVLLSDQTGIVIACGNQALRVRRLQLEGGRCLTAREFLAGHTLRAGERFGSRGATDP